MKIKKLEVSEEQRKEIYELLGLTEKSKLSIDTQDYLNLEKKVKNLKLSNEK